MAEAPDLEVDDEFSNVSSQRLCIDDLGSVYSACKVSCAAEWRELSVHLGIHEDVRKLIRAQNANLPDFYKESLREVLSKWLERKVISEYPPPSWKTLCLAIFQINIRAAKEIGRSHLVPSITREGPANSSSSDSSTSEDVKRFCTCGQCSLQNVIDRGCPDADSTSPYKFPLLDITKLSKDERDDYIYKLEVETRKLNEVYSELYDTIVKLMRGVDVTELKTHIFNLRICNDAINENSLKVEIKNCTDVPSVFLALTVICSWFNHHPLGALIKKFKIDDTAYNDFIYNTLNKFLKKSITELPCNDFGNNIIGSGKFRLKMDTDAAHENIKGGSISFLKGQVAESFDLHPHQLQVLSLKDGCIDVLFSLSLDLHKEIFPLSLCHIQALADISILINSLCQPMIVKSIQYNGAWHKISDHDIVKQRNNSSTSNHGSTNILVESDSDELSDVFVPSKNSIEWEVFSYLTEPIEGSECSKENSCFIVNTIFTSLFKQINNLCIIP